MENSQNLGRLSIVKARFWKRYAEAYINDLQLKRLNKLIGLAPDSFEDGLSNKKTLRHDQDFVCDGYA